MKRMLSRVVALLQCVGCSDDDNAGTTDAGTPDSTTSGQDGALPDAGSQDAGPGPDGAVTGSLSEQYPGDVGLGNDPAVVWFEDFEEGSLGAIAARYDQVRDNGGWELVGDTPNGTLIFDQMVVATQRVGCMQ